ncbi:MAG: hypothetical protein HY898_02630 [Deltaproteobacteria bacterium]|nr:hypothetical protein [Deltaproteobacteria bacterium]
MADYLPAMPHGPIVEEFPNVFVVTGGFRFAPALSITRNMTIVRQGGELILINSVRLTPDGEAELAKLGKVTHLLRIGAFHGADDPYFMDRYAPVLWAPPKTRHKGGLTTGRELKPGDSPLDKATVFGFEHGRRPEVALILEHEGGVLVTCDSYQNWTTFEGCSTLGKVMMRLMKFGPTLIGGPWTKEMGPGVRADFDRLLEAPFQHLISGHGTVLRDKAKEGLRTAIAHRFG